MNYLKKKRIMKNSLLLLPLLLLGVWGFAQSKTGSILLKNGTVLTVTKGTLQNTDVLIVNGKFTQWEKISWLPPGPKW